MARLWLRVLGAADPAGERGLFPRPPTTAQCEQQQHLACYAPFQYHQAYDLGPLYRKGLDGKGETIVIVDPFGYQFIRGELAVFDKAFGLPAPPSFRSSSRPGRCRRSTRSTAGDGGLGRETSLDVEYAHAMAPGANILLAETPVGGDRGRQRVPADRQGRELRHQPPPRHVITQSFGATEQTFPSAQSILALRSAYKNAAANGVSVLAATGDQGADRRSRTDTAYFTAPGRHWPASDPLVTAVGGTQMHLTASGAHLQPDTVWNDTNLLGTPAAGGGGRSVVFKRPAYQNGVAGAVGPARGSRISR